MNAFASSIDPVVSARVLADQHVAKMPTEGTQVLHTALQLRGVTDPRFYRVSHEFHPVTRRAASSPGYAAWLLTHSLALAAEYTRRFKRTHAALRAIEVARDYVDAAKVAPADFALAMPDEFVTDCPFESYRCYLNAKYNAWADKGRPARFTDSSPADWYIGRYTRIVRIHP